RDDCGVQASFRGHSYRDGEGHREWEGDDADDQPGEDVPFEVADAVALPENGAEGCPRQSRERNVLLERAVSGASHLAERIRSPFNRYLAPEAGTAEGTAARATRAHSTTRTLVIVVNSLEWNSQRISFV